MCKYQDGMECMCEYRMSSICQMSDCEYCEEDDE